jgi:sirohydrochlorin ferrochelatase
MLVPVNAATHVILVFHGSQARSAQTDAERFTQTLSSAHPDWSFSAGYLQFCSPDISGAFAQAVSAGATTVLFWPLFVLSGKHVEQDLPRVFQECGHAYPQVTIKVLPHLGADPAFVEWLTARVKQA